MRHHLLFSTALLCLFAGAQAVYATCPNGSNTSTGGTFCSGTITTPDTTSDSSSPVVASPYPAPITVSGMSGAVSGVSVAISGWNFPSSYPYTLELMLVSPGGQALVFFAGNCGDNQQSLSNFNLTLSDTASGIPPNGFNQDCTNNATYKPYGNASFLGGCPTFAGATPSSASCANGSTTNFTNTFTGATPNGTWNVYAEIYDDQEAQGTLQINLSLTTEVTQSATTTSLNASPSEIFNSSPDNSTELTATVTSGGGTVNEGQVQFYDNGLGLGTPVAVSGGQAQIDAIYGASTPEGLHQMTATYTDTASNPKFETSNDNSNPTSLFIDNHTVVSNGGTTFCNSGTITVSGTGSDFTSPYPQHVFVTGLSGSLAGVTLTLNNINEVNGLHDWKVLLVGPDGTPFVPMAFAGGYANASGITLNLSDSGSALLALGTSDTAPANNGTYLPTAYGTFTAPSQNQPVFAPPTTGYNYPMTQGSATFAGTFASENINNATSPWSLYIDDEGGDADTVGGYCLTFAVNSGAATTTAVTASPNPDTTNTQVTLTATVKTTSGNTPVTSGSVKFEQQGNPTPLGTASLNGAGQASVNFTPTSEGAYNITAIYAGVAGTYNQSQGSTTLQVDNQTTETNNGGNNYSFCNPGPITIGGGNAVPQAFPSRVLVSGLPGAVSAVTLTLDDVSYSPDAADLEMMLVGPNTNNNIVFWGNVGSQDGGAFTDQNFTIADGGTLLPASGTPTSGTYSPAANSGFTLAFAAPAPSSPNLAPPDGTATLDGQFQGTSPNGYYDFFVQQVQSAGGDTGSVGQHCVNITITPPVLAITKSHTGSFTQGDTADTYTITVTNNGPGPTAGTLTLADTLPTGMSAASMSETAHTGGGTGSDWTCTASSATCTRTTAMPSGEADTITLTVSVSYSTATGTNAVTNSVTVSGGGASNAPTANDETTVNIGPGYVLTITASPAGDGTVTPNPTNSAGMPAGHYVPGTIVTLTANPAAGYNFSSWSGSSDLSSTTANPTTITMNSATESVTASFVVNNVSVTVGTSPSGLSFSVDSVNYTTSQMFTWQVGSSHTIATSSPQGSSGTRYTFTGWSDSGTISHMVTASSGTTSYTASFSTSYLLTTAASPSADGSVGVSQSSPTSDGYYPSGTQLQLTATPASSGYVFQNWTGTTNSSTNPLMVTMNSPISETANFVVNNVNVTVGTSPSGLSFSVDGTPYTSSQVLTWQVGTSHTIATSSPQGASGTRYTFTGWSDSGAISHMVTASSGTTSYTASFSTSYLLTTAASPPGGGTVTPGTASPTGDGYYPATTQVQLTASPSALYAFTGWSGGPDLSSTSANPTTVTMNGPESVTASFMLTYTAIGGQVSVTETGLLFSPLLANPGNPGSPGGGTTTFTVTNTSGSTITGPIQLVLNSLPAGVTGANNTGTFSGSPYWTVPNSSSLANGASLTVTVQLNYPSSTAVSTTPAVYTGSL
ncbi:MAG TPA: Ig-like domain repeat protein [Bryobacteraceae bacterium]|nr:Ig-like domain repeat protein [Bryobacteraceae bacterium]